MTDERAKDDIEALLPWHAAGTLGADDAARIEAALARDPELARRFALVREEFHETVRLNEALGAPSPKAFERLMRRIESEPAAARARRGSVAIGRRLQALLVALSPRALAWAAAAATILILLQAGLLAALFVGGPGHSYRTAAVERANAPGSFALVGFSPQASAQDITKFLEAFQASIVEGPRAGGLYRVRIGEGSLSRERLAEIVGRMQQQSDLVRFAAPTD